MTPAVHAFFSPATLGWVLLLGAAAWSVQSAGSPAKEPTPDWKWWLLLVGVLVCFRWPLIWLPYELHVDESLLVAGGMTLRHDPLFWRAVDGGTAGPLDYYALLPAGFITPPHGYAVARITAAVLIAGLLATIGETLACVASRAVARVAVLPLLAFEAFVTDKEFVHYSTELVPNFLLAMAAYFIVRQYVRPATRNIWIAALLLGAVPFGKLQAVPLAALLWFLLAGFELRHGRRANLGRLLIGALLPVAGVLVSMSLAGEIENVVIPFLNNFGYVHRVRHSWGYLARFQWDGALTNGYLALWLAGSAVYFLGVLLVVRRAPQNLRSLQLAALSLIGVALFCILAPGRNYAHYVNFLTLPVCGVLGLSLAMVMQTAAGAPAVRLRVLAGGFFACGLLPQLVLRASPRPDPYAFENLRAPEPAERELTQAVRALTTPGEALGLWGWRCSLYVDTGLRQATRQAVNESQILAEKWQAYYLRRYLADLQASAPPIFIDSTGPRNFLYHDMSLGYEVYPPLHAWVDGHYAFFGEVDAVRIYVRNDRLAAAKSVWPPNRRQR